MSELPQGWVKTTLGELSEYVTSGSRDWSKYYSSKGALFVRTQDINKNRLRSYDEIARVSLPSKVEGKRTRLKKDDLLITITGANVGKCAQVSEDPPEAYVSQSVALVRLSESSLAKYLHKHLLSPVTEDMKTWLEENSYGMGRPVLSLDNVRSVPIKLAPLAEQACISDKLDVLLGRVDAIHDRLDRVPLLLKRFRKSVLAAATSGDLTEGWRDGKTAKWDYLRAADVCAKVQSGGTPKEGFAESGVPFLKVYNIVDQQVSFDYRPQYIAETIHRGSMAKSITMPGDVLMNIVGPPLGKVAIVPDASAEWNINQAITLFRPSERISTGWLYCVLCGGKNIEDIILETKGMVGQQNISLSQCRNFVFPVPPPEEQAEIVRRVEALFALADKVQAQYEAARARVDKLPPALLAKAFRGELVPQDPNDEPAEKLLERLRAANSGEAKPMKNGCKSTAAQNARMVS